MNINDTVRIRKTDIIGIITRITGRNIYIKTEEFPIDIMCRENELEPFGRDDILIGCIMQSYGDKS